MYISDSQILPKEYVIFVIISRERKTYIKQITNIKHLALCELDRMISSTNSKQLLTGRLSSWSRDIFITQWSKFFKQFTFFGTDKHKQHFGVKLKYRC